MLSPMRRAVSPRPVRKTRPARPLMEGLEARQLLSGLTWPLTDVSDPKPIEVYVGQRVSLPVTALAYTAQNDDDSLD